VIPNDPIPEPPGGYPNGWPGAHKHIYTSDAGGQFSTFGCLVCVCGKVMPYKVPVEVEL